jgi:hypothetical protein
MQLALSALKPDGLLVVTEMKKRQFQGPTMDAWAELLQLYASEGFGVLMRESVRQFLSGGRCVLIDRIIFVRSSVADSSGGVPLIKLPPRPSVQLLKSEHLAPSEQALNRLEIAGQRPLVPCGFAAMSTGAKSTRAADARSGVYGCATENSAYIGHSLDIDGSRKREQITACEQGKGNAKLADYLNPLSAADREKYSRMFILFQWSDFHPKKIAQLTGENGVVTVQLQTFMLQHVESTAIAILVELKKQWKQEHGELEILNGPKNGFALCLGEEATGTR